MSFFNDVVGGLFGSNSLGGKFSLGIGSWLNDISGQSSSAKRQYQNELKLQQQAQNFNANQAQIERNWQEQMSNTAHQRAVSDLQAAGLNPVLSANGGADASAGATASSGIGSASAGNSPTDMLTNIVGMLNSSKQTEAIVDKTKSEIENIDADTANKRQEYELQPQIVKSLTKLQDAQTAKEYAEANKLFQDEIESQVRTIGQQIINDMGDMDLTKRKAYFNTEMEVAKQQLKAQMTSLGFESNEIYQAIDRAFGTVGKVFSGSVSYSYGQSTSNSHSTVGVKNLDYNPVRKEAIGF